MNFQNNYCDENGNPIVFYVGRLPRGPFRPVGKIYIWAFNEFFEERFFLVGDEDGDGLTLDKARHLVQILNQKAQEKMVPVDFDDWSEDLSEIEQDEIIRSSKKDNSKFR